MPFLIIYGVFVLAAVGLVVRNQRVYDYRSRLINYAYDQENWQAEVAIYKSVGYNTMVGKFWKPLASFYDHKPFKDLA